MSDKPKMCGRYIQCGDVLYGPSYSIWGPETSLEPGVWQVVDAECEVIARCKSEDAATVVLGAINLLHDKLEKEDYDAAMSEARRLDATC